MTTEFCTKYMVQYTCTIGWLQRHSVTFSTGCRVIYIWLCVLSLPVCLTPSLVVTRYSGWCLWCIVLCPSTLQKWMKRKLSSTLVALRWAAGVVSFSDCCTSLQNRCGWSFTTQIQMVKMEVFIDAHGWACMCEDELHTVCTVGLEGVDVCRCECTCVYRYF